MNYKDTIAWMFRQLPMYQNKGKSAFRKDLSNIILLSEHLNNPEQNFKSIHVGGTNGKGSTSHMLASILQEAGYKVGLYTSPHLKDYRERIKINGQCIDKASVVSFIENHKSFFESNDLSFFEMTVGLAFYYFSEQKIDVAIIEVGMGGRLDATNIILPELSIITNIGLDHTQFLGETLAKIAVEKAGIIKKDIPVIIGETQLETKSIFESIAQERNSSIVFADQQASSCNYQLDLLGHYQEKNCITVLCSVKTLNQKGFKIEEKHISLGLGRVVKNTGLLGRWQVLQQQPLIICDTAHNTEGLTLVINQLKNETYKSLRIVFGVVKDKSVENLLPLLPRQAVYYLCKPNVERGMEVNDLHAYFASNGFVSDHYTSVKEALEQAKKDADDNDLIYVGGSTFVVAEVV